MSLEASLQPLAASLNITPVTLALCIGVLGGFVIAKIFRSGSGKPQTPLTSFQGTARSTFSSQRPATLTGGSVSLTAGGTSVEMDLAFCRELKQILKEGNKIQAIKVFREKTNTDLAAAKTCSTNRSELCARIPRESPGS